MTVISAPRVFLECIMYIYGNLTNDSDVTVAVDQDR